jgi:Na+/H+ antiporter NhaD/arsenite permease-like protein
MGHPSRQCGQDDGPELGLAALAARSYEALCCMKNLLLLIVLALLAGVLPGTAANYQPHYPQLADGSKQYAAFPVPPEKYPAVEGGLWEVLESRVRADPFNLAASIIFLLAIVHTFASGFFIRLAHKYEHLHDEALSKRGALSAERPDGVPEVSFLGTLFHFLGEIEAVFGLWVIALAGAAIYYHTWLDFELYLSEDRAFTEPMFVVIIMAISASRPVLRFAEGLMAQAAKLGGQTPAAWWFSVLVIAPVLGSFITEPAAMTIGALLLAKKFYRYHPPARLAYATLGLLFVNISIGGTLTNFAAPPVLMVAGVWHWNTLFMLEHFGWKALASIVISSTLYFLLFRKALAKVSDLSDGVADGKVDPALTRERETPVPAWVTLVHLVFLAWTVYTAHFPVLFIGGFLFFLAFIIATRHHQNEVALRSPILVGFFLAALVIHGGCPAWWIAPVIKSLSDQTLMLGATILTAFNDNAAITYLAAQVDGIGMNAKYAVVAGAVTGGGLTVIANAPNPAGQSILSRFFKDGVSPLGLFLGALAPTLIAYLCFTLLPSGERPEQHPAKPAVEQSQPGH